MAFLDFTIFVAPVVLTLMSLSSLAEGRLTSNSFDPFTSTTNGFEGTKWAVLVAGSNTFNNYRHQADICHAYHILRKGGLKDENIVVFMYDDIAYNKENPKPGVIINRPHGKNIYPGVPKDYTGEHVTSSNLYAVILGNQTAIKGGSGKVVNSGPNDHIFIYYADHGAAGILAMPDYKDSIYAKDFIHVLKKKHVSKSYKSMVIYVEACESGSIFDGILPEDLNIYVTTASNPNESSWACYCDSPGLPKQYKGVCLGDLYSVSWMENSDMSDPTKETLKQQYDAVKHRTGNSTGEEGSSHVMQYGDLSLSKDHLALYLGANSSKGKQIGSQSKPTPLAAVEQREADLLYLRAKVRRAPVGSNEQRVAQKQLDEEISHRKHVDESVAAIGEALFGETNGPLLFKLVRPGGQPLVDDWDCFKAMVKTYETYCGSLRSYGRKYMRVFANTCNAGIHQDQMAQTSARVCAT